MILEKPLVVLDLETTGTWIEKDRIIEIGMIRCEPDGTRRVYEQRINPGIPIPARVTEITGIRDEDVKPEPSFRQVAQDILDFLENADLAGFNLERFDLPLLEREFSDFNYKFAWSDRAVYDAQKIFHIHEKRDLTAAYAYYCHKDLQDAHTAQADAQATLEILEAQLQKYGQGNDRIETLQAFDYSSQDNCYVAGRRFRWWNGELYMMFGKYGRKSSLKEVAQQDRGYLQWILSQDFSEEVKDLVEGALEGKFPQPPKG